MQAGKVMLKLDAHIHTNLFGFACPVGANARQFAELAHRLAKMSLLSNIVGFSLFGLAARFGQLGIQKRNLFDSA